MQPQNQPGVSQTVSDVHTAINAGKAVAKDVKPLVNSLKSGYRTSEFWLHLAVQVMAGLAIVLPDNNVVKAVAALSSLSSASVYSIGRVQLKNTGK